MPDFKLRAPESEGTTADDVFVTGDPAERAQLLARGYTDVTDEAAEQPPPAKPAERKATGKAAANAELHQADGK
jgi:ABC-type Fe3+ transport system substrate-binding protein